MKITFIDSDDRSYQRSTKKPISIESSAVKGDITIAISSSGKCWLKLSSDQEEAAAIGYSILAACQNVSTTSEAG